MARAKKEVKVVKGRSLAALADELYLMREERYKVQREAERMKKAESEIESKILSELRLSKDTTGIAGKNAMAQLVTKEKVVAEDWDKIYAYVVKNKAFDLIQRRLSDTAVKERWENDKLIPGVNKMRIEELSLTKV